MTDQARTLRALLAHGRIIAAPGAPDALSARLIARTGFDAVYMTGLGATASRLGAPDLGLLSQTEMADQARAMAAAAPRGRAVVIEGHGHMVPMTAPAAVNRALADWLAEEVAP